MIKGGRRWKSRKLCRCFQIEPWTSNRELFLDTESRISILIHLMNNPWQRKIVEMEIACVHKWWKTFSILLFFLRWKSFLLLPRGKSPIQFAGAFNGRGREKAIIMEKKCRKNVKVNFVFTERKVVVTTNSWVGAASIHRIHYRDVRIASWKISSRTSQ